MTDECGFLTMQKICRAYFVHGQPIKAIC